MNALDLGKIGVAGVESGDFDKVDKYLLDNMEFAGP
jgi:hypothetical protein